MQCYLQQEILLQFLTKIQDYQLKDQRELMITIQTIKILILNLLDLNQFIQKIITMAIKFNQTNSTKSMNHLKEILTLLIQEKKDSLHRNGLQKNMSQQMLIIQMINHLSYQAIHLSNKLMNSLRIKINGKNQSQSSFLKWILMMEVQLNSLMFLKVKDLKILLRIFKELTILVKKLKENLFN